MSSSEAVTAIRSYLADNEGRSDAFVGQLLTSFDVAVEDDEGKAAIEQALRDGGVALDHSIMGLSADDPVVLQLATPPTLATSANGNGSAPPPAGTTPPNRDGGFSGFIRRRPRAVVWSAVGLALIVGIGLGAVAASDPQVQKDLDATRAQLSDLRADLAGERDRSRDSRGRLATANGRIQELTAKGEVPNLRGKDADEIDSLLEKYDWTVARRSQVSSSPPGTIIAQSPAAGKVLKAGKEIQVTVAKAAPPSWKTILSLSGSGSKRTDEFEIPAGKKVRVQYTFGGESNDTIQVKDPSVGDDDFGDLIFNEIGAKSGTTRLYGAEGPTYLDITGDSWTIEVQVYR